MRSMTLHAERFFQVALLGRREIVIEDDHVDADCRHFGGQFFDFALTDKSRRLGSDARLDGAADDLGAGAAGQFGQLVEGFFGAGEGATARTGIGARGPFHSKPTRIARSRPGLRGGVGYASEVWCTGTPGTVPLDTPVAAP